MNLLNYLAAAVTAPTVRIAATVPIVRIAKIVDTAKTVTTAQIAVIVTVAIAAAHAISVIWRLDLRMHQEEYKPQPNLR